MVFVMLMGFVVVFGQEPKRKWVTLERPSPPQSANNTVPDFRLDSSKPAIYIEFERHGQAIQPMELRLAETGEATFSSRKGRDVWLRLHNNTHWAIQFRTASMYLSSEIWHTPDHGICALADGAEVGLIYYLEDEEGKRTCMGGGGCMSSTAWLIPGRSLIFSVPRKALRKSEQICVVFTYEWETYKSFPSYSPTEHAVRFSSQLGLEK